MSGVTALQNCLGAEHAALYGYGVLGGVLAGVAGGESDLERARSSYADHRVLRDDLVALLSAAGVLPTAAAAAYDLPFPVIGAESPRRLARLLERRAGSLYGMAVAATVDGDRAFAAAALRGCAVRAVAWGAPVVAFPGVSEAR